MPYFIEFQMDGGLNNFSAKIDKLAAGLKDWSPLFRAIISYFEGKSITNLNYNINPGTPQPIQKIWESKGAKIGSDWTNTEAYEKWKAKYGERKKIFDVPVSGEQVLTGATLAGLLDSGNSGAIRIINALSMTYGVHTQAPNGFNYSYYWQQKRRILDFFPDMITDLKRILGAFIKGASELEWTGE